MSEAKATIESILGKQGADLTDRDVAEAVFDLLSPSTYRNLGATYYRRRAVDCLTFIFSVEKIASVEVLVDRLSRLVEVSPATKADVGGVYGRLAQLVKEAV